MFVTLFELYLNMFRDVELMVTIPVRELLYTSIKRFFYV